VFDETLFNFYRAAIALRTGSTALRRGDIEFVSLDNSAMFLGFRRADANETLLVGLNRGDSPFAWKVPLKKNETVSQIFTAAGLVDQVTVESTAGNAIVTIPAVDGVVLRVEASK
jgi:hypothetical protein